MSAGGGEPTIRPPVWSNAWSNVDTIVLLEKTPVTTERFWPLVEATVEELLAGRTALDFATWRTLTQAGLDDSTAASLAGRFVAASL